MSQDYEQLKGHFILFVIISIIIGFLILAVKSLSSVEVKHSKPHTPKPLEERLKMLPASAKQLSDEAKLIFPEQLNQPESFDFHWTHQTKKLELRIPIERFSDQHLKSIYLNRYLEHNWNFEEKEYKFTFINQQSKNESCIDKHVNENSNYRVVKFVVKGEPCW